MTRPSLRGAGALAGTLCLALTLGWSPPAGADETGAAAGFAAELDRLLADPRLDGGRASVVVRDADSGETLYEHGADDRLMPASTTKLLTSAAAMATLGPDYRFRTELLSDGPVTGGTLDGDLYLRGSGDPTTLAADYDALAADLAALGVDTVTGDLIADDTRFDDVRLGRSWSWDSESDYYAAQTSALTLAPDTDYDAGSVRVAVAPGAAEGDPAAVTLTPATDYMTVENRATTVAEGEPATAAVTREHGTNTLVITGAIPRGGAPVTSWTAVWEPTGYATAVFADALAAHGVRVGGDTVLGRATPGGADVLAAHESMPLSELLTPFMKLSNNTHAEALVKAMGRETRGEGTWEAGLAAVMSYAESAGVDTGTYRQVDGSGLSRLNSVPAAEITALLVAVRAEPWFATWYEALPVACGPDRVTGGTLRSRMCGTPAAGNVRAKTGSLTGATALSGYVTTADGHELAFGVLLNDFLGAAPKDLEDAVATTLASSGTQEDAGAGAADAPDAAAPAREPDPGPGLELSLELGLECSWLKPAAC
ncbi:D-alanyl-D-alanine carboxypeptidase/D-alanyl-D-alanine endopeptidase [Streptomyces specialis]|uniref:D-alanyl-D-alanine carboxypeptidase/D-alanyl-D-alanine endopeptidase n=1 Tax=Streptomyces specialis TaxID=498367 RepID=UPI00073F5EC1|nr:D-alanyl-D-alanine carboxypeptidase/D-alanyl-D-alanine-endopeptidase [Streptomyces specialis]